MARGTHRVIRGRRGVTALRDGGAAARVEDGGAVQWGGGRRGTRVTAGRRCGSCGVVGLEWDLFSAGTDTNTNTISVPWMMVAKLLRHPAVMSKVRGELQDALHPAQPSPARCLCRTGPWPTARMEVGGWLPRPPRHTKVIVNLYGIMCDPTSWPRHDGFVPGRFAGHGRGLPEHGRSGVELMPFGAGQSLWVDLEKS
ncbi:hypothetical protein C2845_PM03G36350 [Panicum miliaceum]|uniref:Uncharacterized protein n=1 Tax=Panicum miliaceum TaxID=4540 RepID=A0A3L6TDU0_PANMI|nr:hypothetical protein C2845_PM03G36350 [Panicum miliaceum]